MEKTKKEINQILDKEIISKREMMILVLNLKKLKNQIEINSLELLIKPDYTDYETYKKIIIHRFDERKEYYV